jgi:hypothetical protein
MNEKKINQILKNQKGILLALSEFSRINDTVTELEACYFETEELLNPPKQESLAEKTKDEFKEVRSKFGSRK